MKIALHCFNFEASIYMAFSTLITSRSFLTVLDQTGVNTRLRIVMQTGMKLNKFSICCK